MENPKELKVIWNKAKSVPEQKKNQSQERASLMEESDLQKRFFSGQITSEEYEKKKGLLRIV
jgi:uncharacterized membrane protein